MIRRSAVLALLLVTSQGVRCQEIAALSVASAQEALKSLGPSFTTATHTTVTFTFGSSSFVEDKLKAGTPADVVVATSDALASLAQGKIVDPASVVTLWNATIGLAVRTGAPKPDISTVEKLRATLLAAKSIAYNDPAGGTAAGPVVARVLKDLGIADQLAAKIKYDRPASVARGEIEVNMTNISELLAVEGVTIVGPLPEALKPVTPYGAAVVTSSTSKERALAFIRYLASAEVVPVLRAKGLEPLGSR